jgi:hypothetical protein
MRRVKEICWTCFFLAIMLSAYFYSYGGYWVPVIACLLLILLWGIGVRLDQPNLITVTLIVFCSLLAIGSFLEIWVGWLVLSMSFMIAAWDLYWFDRRLSSVGEIREANIMFRLHVVRLISASMVGLLLSMTTLIIRVELSFGLALVLSLVIILGLRQWILIGSRTNE